MAARAERKQIEKTLRGERELLQAIYATIPVMLTIYDPDVEEIVLNEHVERVTGWTREDRARANRCLPLSGPRLFGGVRAESRGCAGCCAM